MGMLLRFDPEIGMNRSVGDWPNGVVILDLSNPCEPAFAVDWKFQPLIAAEHEEGEEKFITPPEGEDPKENMQRITLEEYAQACETSREANVGWATICHSIAKIAGECADNIQMLHMLGHLMEFLVQCNGAFTEEAPFRDPDGKRTE